MTPLRIGSRPSSLALAQAAIVQHQLEALLPGLAVEVVQISTSGDRMATASLAQVGGKGLFIRELEQALSAKTIDLAVHSMKDLPAVLAPAYRIAAVPARGDPRDALLTRDGMGWDALAPGARLGTASARRRLEALRLRPNLEILPLRGNVDTRLRRLAAGDFDAIILAMAGLKRLNRIDGVSAVELDERDFVPSAGQGALAIESLAEFGAGGSNGIGQAIAYLNDPCAAAEVAAERAFLAKIGASCVSPVGVKGTLTGDHLALRALLFSLDGAHSLSGESEQRRAADPAALGEELGARLLARGAGALIQGST
ncbi:MAG TPA: hydroxymethylbilane synthase [Candidatus Binataceae bacterium]|nr:hydroxymethylbilane synthase [Candidatus Binataceae bacterium]